MKPSQPMMPRFCLGLFFGAAMWAPTLEAVTTISAGHADIFEVEYLTTDEDTGQLLTTPVLHLGVHTDTNHYEPAEVLLEVKETAFIPSTATFPSPITDLLGASAWILPADLEEAANLGVIEGGVAKAGFPNNNAVTFSLVGAGPDNPGNFVLFSAANSIRLAAIGGAVGSNASFSIVTGHIHYNWGFSAPGTYTFDLKASYTDADFGLLESAVETYTFHVIPEPSSGALVLAGMAALGAARRKGR